MSFIKCYDVAEMVIEEATNQFGSLLKLDEERREELKECCDIVDILSQRFGGTSYEVEVDDKTNDIIVSLICGEMEVDTTSDDFYKLMCRAKKVGFKAYKNEQLQIDFILNSIWVRAF